MYIDVDRILAIHFEATTNWHDETPEEQILQRFPDPLEALLVRHHLANLDVWELEDVSRLTVEGCARIVRERQEANRLRNSLVEEIDRRLLPKRPRGKLITETPGMMIDRLSILDIKRYYLGAVVEEQMLDVRRGLQRLLNEVRHGAKWYKIYDNPKIYADEKR